MSKLFILLALLYSTTTESQMVMTSIGIGEKVPSSIIKSYKGKLVIIDFWNISCIPCIEAMPKMDSLQKEFADKIQIILVTKNNLSAVETLFSRIKIKRPGLPIITSDTVLSKLFPHNSVPHHVWVDSSGCVLYITDGYNATYDNISKVLNGSKIEVNYKKQFAGFDTKTSLLTEGKGRLLIYLNYYSVLMQYISEYGKSSAAITKDTLSRTTGLKLINLPLLNLYKIAFGGSISPADFESDSRIIFEVVDKSRFIWPSASTEINAWKSENMYSYESMIPFANQKEVFLVLQQDLNRYLPYDVKVESRKVKCLVLTRLSLSDKIKSKGGTPSYVSNPDDGFSIRNQSIQNTLFISLKAYTRSLQMPVIDSTNYTGNIDIEIRSRLNDLDGMRKELRKYNLDLIKKEIVLPMLVIKDRLPEKML